MARANQFVEKEETARVSGYLLRESVGVLLFFVAAFLSLSLYSHHPHDPSLNYVGSSGAIRNMAGLAGSYLSDALYQGVGFSAWWIPGILLFISIKLFIKRPAEFYFDRILALPVLLSASSLLLALFPPSLELTAGAGGVIGAWGAAYLSRVFGLWGSVLLLLPLILLSVMIITRFSLIGFFETVKEGSVFTTLGFSHLFRSAEGLYIRLKERRKRMRERQEREESLPPVSERAEPVIGVPGGLAPPPVLPRPEGAAEPLVISKPSAPVVRQQPKLPFDAEDFNALEEDSPLPPLSFLSKAEPGQRGPSAESLSMKARILEKKLADFGVQGTITEVRPGPVVTTFEMEPAPGLKASKVIGLSDDLARSLSTPSVRVEGNVPGKSVIGIEIPNEKRETVYLREVLESDVFNDRSPPLTVALGSDINGVPVVANLAKMPHLLIAGTTGSGKSVAVNAMICTILFRAKPEQVRMLMVDPKMLELSVYEGIPHLLSPVVTDVRKAANLLKWAVSEMEERYQLMSIVGVRNLDGYNKLVVEMQKSGAAPTRTVKEGFDMETGQPLTREEPIPLDPLPLILIIIDELADLMMVVGKEVEPAIARLAQMARAAGIHLVLATQRPSVDVLTGLIKANFPTRLSFQVSSGINSRTILDAQGAEHLLGMGDGLFLPPGTSRLKRIHAPFVSDAEIHKLVDFLKKTGKPSYDSSIVEERGDNGGGGGGGEVDGNGAGGGEGYDPLYDEAVAIVIKARKVSTSMVQRHFKIGYNRAARIVEQMEQDGLITSADGAGKRQVVAPRQEE